MYEIGRLEMPPTLMALPIDAVEKALEAALIGAAIDPPPAFTARSGAGTSSQRLSEPPSDLDDDIPF